MSTTDAPPDVDSTPDVSVIIACTRPHLIAGIVSALTAQAGAVKVQVVVVGDVVPIAPDPCWSDVVLVQCADRSPNVRRNIGLREALAPIIAFVDDDAVPEPGWLEQASAMSPAAIEIWTGPEVPVSDHPTSRLVHDVACSVFAEGTRAHVDPSDHEVGWTDAPFCNLVTTTRLIELTGPPSTSVPWDMDDFEFCRRAASKGAVFRNVTGLAIRHDRYPVSVRRWLRTKSRERRRTGEKLVTHTGLYSDVPGVVIAGLVPWIALGLGAAVGRSPRGRVALGAAGFAYLAGVVAATTTRPERANGAGGERSAASAYAATLVSLHVVSVTSLQWGLLRALAGIVDERDEQVAHRG